MLPHAITLLSGQSNIQFSPKEQELYDLFLEEYNDIFPNILNMSEKAIIDTILLNVSILIGEKKLNSYSKLTIAKIQSILKSQNYMQDLLSIKHIREILLSIGSNSNRFPPLNISEINPHCDITSKCYHICGNELVYPQSLNFILCLNCKVIFKPEQIHLFCKECNEDYYSDIYYEEEKHDDFIRATWDHYHCKNYFPEDMKCPKCNEGIYFSSKKNLLKCFNCNWKNKIKTMIWNCKICGKDFFSGAISYIKFENKPNKISYIKTLIDKIPAKPNYVPCCKIDPRNVNFIHNIDCDGILYLGINQGQKIIVCSKCNDILDYNKMLWYCPRCGENFICPEKDIVNNFSQNQNNNAIKINNNNENIIKKNNSITSNYQVMEFDKKKHNKLNSDNHSVDIRKLQINNNDNKNNNKKLNIDKFEKNVYSKIKHIHTIKQRNNNNVFVKEYKQSNTSYDQNDSFDLINRSPTNIFDDKKKNVNVNLNLNININNIYKNNNNQKKNNTKENIIRHALTTVVEPNEDFNYEDFKRNKLIGEGTFGKIYSSTWIVNNCQYALKELISHSQEEIDQIRTEYDLMLDFIKKTDCTGIIRVYGAQSEKRNDGNYHFYVLMELATTDWEKEIKKRAKLKHSYTEGELLTIVKRLIRTFSQLQKFGICHRDIKPQNVLIINNDYKICDFGEAKIVKNNISELHTLRGTELYMSPILFKALKEKKNDVVHNCFKSDVFSLGMCMALGASLSFKTLCEIREVDNMEKMKNILVKYLIAKYSYEFINVLLMMLEMDENKRPDFIELDNKVRD